MTTSMRRLQISLLPSQADFLAARARRDGVSLAEVVRGLIAREAAAPPGTGKSGADSLWEIAGIAEDCGPSIDGVPVSERPDLYLAALAAPQRSAAKKRTQRR